MSIPTEPIGSVPRPAYLLEAMRAASDGTVDTATLDAAYDRAVKDTIAALESTGSPIITDGEQRKPSFATYPLHGATNLAPDGAVIPFADGHTRQLPRLASGPFRYRIYAGSYLARARRYTNRPLKQAVIAPSALSLGIIAVLVVLSLIYRNFWCRYLCPYGALLGLLSLASPLKIRRDRGYCIDCRRCTGVCPGQIVVHRLETVRSVECNGCRTCVTHCPAPGALGMHLAGWRRALPGWSFALFW